MKLNFTVRIPQKDMQKLVNLALENQIPEFSYEITGEKPSDRLSEVADICRILGIDDGSEFPNKLKSIYEDQIAKLRVLALSLGSEIDVTRAWFEQVKAGLFVQSQVDSQKLKALYGTLETEIEVLKKLTDQTKPAADATEAPAAAKLAQRVAALEAEVRIKDARISSLLTLEEPLRRLEFERHNFLTENMLLKTRLASQQNGQPSGVHMQRTRTIQQTTVTESISKTVLPENPSSLAVKTQALLLARLDEALVENKKQKARNFEMEFEMAQLRQIDEFLRIKTEEADKLKAMLDDQNAQIVKLNKMNEENVRSIERLNKKMSDIRENNNQLSKALDSKSEKNKKLMEHINQLESVCAEAKLKNEALIKRINEVEDEGLHTIETHHERIVSTANEAYMGSEHERGTVLVLKLQKKSEEALGYLQELEKARKENAAMRAELNALREADRQKDLQIQQLKADNGLLANRVASLTEARGDSARKLEKAHADLIERDKRNQELEQRLIAIQSELDHAREEVHAQRKATAEAVAERDKVENQKKAKDAEIKDLEKQLSEAKERNGQLQERIKELEVERDNLQNAVKKYESSNSPLKAERDALSEEKKRFDGQKAALQNEIDRLKKDNEGLLAKIEGLMAERDDLNKKHRQKDEKLDSLAEENRNTKKSLQLANEKLEKLAKEVDRLTKENQEKDAALKQAKADLQRLAKELSEAKAEKKRQELELEDGKNKFASLEKQTGQIASQNALLTVENRKLKDRVAALEDAISKLNSQRDSLQKALEEAELKQKAAEGQLARLTEQTHHQIEDLKRQLDSLASKNKELAKRISDLENELKTERNQHSEDVRKLNGVISELKIEQSTFKTENDVLRRQIELLKAEMEAKSREPVKSVPGVQVGLQKENQTLAENLQRAELDHLEAKTEKSALTHRIQLLESQLAVKNAELADYRSNNLKGSAVSPSVLEKVNEMNKLVEENRALKAQIEAGKRRVEILEKELKEKEDRLAKAHGSHDQLLTPEMKEQLALLQKIKSDMFALSNENDQLRRKNELLEFENQEKSRYLEAANARVFPPNTIDMKDHLDAIGKANAQIAALKAEVEGLKRRALDLEAQIELLKRQNVSEKEALEAERRRALETAEQLQKQNAKLLGELELLRKKGDEFDVFRKVTEERILMQQKLFKNEGQVSDSAGDALRNKVRDLEAALELSDKEKKNLRAEIDFLKTQVEELSKQPPKWEAFPSIDLSDDLKQQLKDLRNTKVEMAGAQVQAEMLSRKLAIVQEELDVKQKRLAEAVSSQGSASAEAVIPVSEHQRVTSELGAEIIRWQTEAHGLQGRLERANKELEAQKADREALAAKLRELCNSTIPALQDELSKKRAAYDGVNAENNSFRRQLEILEAENQGLNQKAKFLGELMKEYSTRLNAFQREKLRADQESQSVQSGPSSPFERTEIAVTMAVPSEVGANSADWNTENALLEQKVAELQAFIDRKIPEYEERIRMLLQGQKDLMDMKAQQIGDLKALAYEGEARIEELNDTVAKLKAQNKLLAESAKTFDSVPKEAFKKLAEEAATAQSECDRLKHALAKAMQESEGREAQIKAMEEQQAKLAAALKAMTEDKVGLEEALSKCSRQIETHKKTINEYEQRRSKPDGGAGVGPAKENPVGGEPRSAQEGLKKKLEDAEPEKDQLKRKLEAAQAEIQERTKNLELLNGLLDQFKDRVKKDAEKIDEAGNRLIRLEEELAKAKMALEDKTKNLDRVQGLLGDKEKQNKALQDALEDLKKQNSVIQDENQRLSAELKDLSRQLATRERESAQLHKEVATLEAENQELRNRLSESEKNHQKAKMENEDLASKLLQEKNRSEALLRQLTDKEKAAAELKARVQSQEASIGDLTEENKKLPRRLEEAEDKLRQAKQEIEKLNGFIAESEQLLSKAQGQARSLGAQLEDERKEASRLRQKLTDLENSGTEVPVAFERKEVVRVSSTRANDGELDELKTKLEAAKQELKEAQNKLKIKANELQDALDANAKLQSDLPLKNQEVANLSQERNTLSDRLKEISASNDSNLQKAQELAAELRRIQPELASLQQKVASLGELLAIRDKEAEDLRRQWAAGQKELIEVNARLSQVQIEGSRRRVETQTASGSEGAKLEDLEKLNAALAKLKAKKEALGAQVENLQGEVASKNRQLDGERGAFRKAIEEGKELVAKLATVGHENNALKIQIENLKVQLAKAREDQDAESANANGLQERIRQLQGQTDQKDQELSRMQNELIRIKEEVEAQRKRHEELRALPGSSSDNQLTQELLAKVSAANEELMRAKAQVEKLERDLAEARKNLADLQNELTNPNGRLQSLQKELADKNTKLSDLRGELTKATSRAEVMEARVKNLEQQLAEQAKEDQPTDRNTFLGILEKELGSYEALMAELNRAKLDKEALERSIAVLQKESADKIREINALKSAKENAERAAQDQASQLLNAQIALQKANGEIEIRAIKIKSLEGELEQLRRLQREQPKSSVNVLELPPEISGVNTVRNELSQVRIELQTTRGKERTLEGELGSLKDANANLQKQIAALTSELQETQEKLAKAGLATEQLKRDGAGVQFELNVALQENKKLKEELEASRKANEQLNGQNTALKNALEKMKEGLSNWEVDSKARDNEVSSLREEVDQKDEMLTEMHEKNKKLAAEIQAIQLEGDRANRKCNSLEDDLARVRSQLSAAIADRDKLKSELFKTLQELEKEQDEVAELKTDIELMKTRIAEAEENEKERVAQSRYFIHASASFRDTNVESASTKNEQRLMIIEAENKAQIDEMNRQIADLNQQLEDGKQDLSRAQKKLKEAQNQASEAAKENGSLKTENEDLLTRLEDLEREEEARKRTIGQLDSQVKDLSNQLKKKSNEVADLESQVLSLEGKTTELESQRRRIDVSIEQRKNTQVKSSVNSTSVSNTTLNLDMRDYLAKLTALSGEANEIRFQNETLKEKLQKTEEEKAGLSRQVEQLDQTVEGLNQALRDKNAQSRQFSNESASLRSENDALKSKLKAANDDLAQSHRTIANLKTEIDGLQSEIRSKFATVGNLTDELNRVKRDAEATAQKMSVSLKRNEEFKNRFNAQESMEGEAAAKLREKIAENEKLALQVEDLKRELENAKRRWSEGEEEMRAKDRKIKSAEQRADSLASELSGKNEAELKWNAERAKLKNELEALRIKTGTLQLDIEARNGHQNAVQALTSELANKERQVTTLQSELNAARSEIESLKKRFKSTETDLLEKIAALTEEVNSLRGQRVDTYEVDRLTRKVKELEGELAKERDSSLRSGGSSKAYEAQIKGLMAEIENFRNNKQNLESELMNKSQEVHRLRTELQEAKQQLTANQYSR